MFINTTVVQALMALRGIDETTLANVAFVAPKQLREWLNGAGEKADEKIAFERQLEVLRTLGIHNESPRGDVIHHWHVREPLFGSARRIYWALQAVVEAFGHAQVVFLSREADPALTLRNEACFVLKFDSFRAVLHVEGHPMRSLRFQPDAFSGLQWMPGSYGVLLDEREYEALAPGYVEPKMLEAHLHTGADAFHWERLTQLAREANVSAEQLLAWVSSAGTPQLPGTSGIAGPKDTPTSAAVAAPPTSASVQTQVPRRRIRPREAAASVQTAVHDAATNLGDLGEDNAPAAPAAQTPRRRVRAARGLSMKPISLTPPSPVAGSGGMHKPNP